MIRCIENHTVCAIIGIFFCGQLFGHEKAYDYFYTTFKKNFPAEHDVRDKQSEDEALREAYELGCVIYKNLVELVVLYYCKDMIADAQVLYDKVLMETCKDAFGMIKCLALYIPLVCKNKKTSKKVKALKLAGVGCVMTALISSLRAICSDQFSQKNKKIDLSEKNLKNKIMKRAL